MRRFSPLYLALVSLAFCLTIDAFGAGQGTGSLRIYFGTYTGGKSQGIYSAAFDPQTGKLGQPALAAEAKNPSFLALHPNRQFLYAVGELNSFNGKPAGAVSAFRIAPDNARLTLLNQEPSGGAGPCHLSVDQSGRCVLVANYGSGSIASLPIKANGELGEPASVIQHQGSSANSKRQTGPHAHFIRPDPDNRRALVCDLGLDKVLLYDLDPASATLKPSETPFATLPPGSGPRHFAIHTAGKWVYVVNELACTVSALEYEPKTGALKSVQTISTLPAGETVANTCAGIDLHPSGKFLYASNRGHDSIAVYAIDPSTGHLSLVQHQSTLGKTPRHFAVVPGGQWLIAENQASDSVVLFRLDPATGKLQPAGQQLEIGSPVCAVFLKP